jgi:hypothetical protein
MVILAECPLACEGGNIMESLLFENVQSTSPAQVHGDLHLTPKGFYFLAFKPASTWTLALQANLGLLGIWLMHRANKKRTLEMTAWRTDHQQNSLDELVRDLPGSWTIPQDQIRTLKPGLLGSGVVIKNLDDKKFSVEIKKQQWKPIQDFAQAARWQVMTHIV